ncbi:MAG: nuclear transport factor 2 family protein [Ignavibacteriae bacterium]|nr:nuclear transport factor 2 family protein [Ignavibacteriota bacterium]
MILQNARFYEAFENADLDALDSIWLHSQRVRCIHPGWDIIVGWEAVRESWERVFASNAAMKFSLRNVAAEIHGKLGVVVLIEEIVWRSGSSVESGSVLATNLFEHDGKTWRMIHHHGSPLIGEKDSAEGGSFRYN